MCGIFGYIGNRTAEPILIDGLRTLEYRGYDSAGIFVPGYGTVKAVGPIENLAKAIIEPINGSSGIAHTRWATHGEPTKVNTHPHTDASGQIYVVHNGIIENYRELKEGLVAQGITFYSNTDTEVLAKLIGTFYAGSLQEAVQNALLHVRGTYGIAVMTNDNPDEIVVARMGSPIVLGFGNDGNFVSSDPSALLVHTKDVVYLEDGEIAVIQKDAYHVCDIKGEKKSKTPETIQWDADSIQKQGYEHFMLKEIFEVPEVIANTIRGRLLLKTGRAKLGGLEPVLSELASMRRLQVIGCGSAYYAGLVGRYILEEYAGLPVEVELASEYRYKKNIYDEKSAVLAVSQSGETADTLASIKKANKNKVLTLGIVNVVGSTIARETHAGVYNHAGPEVAVASTKAFISQLTVFVLLTLLIAREKEMGQDEGVEIAQALSNLPKVLTEVLSNTSPIQEMAKKYAQYSNAIFIGRKLHTPIAYEAALKLKEVTYIHAEGYAGGELKHGPISMLDEEFPVIALCPQDDVYEKMVSNVEQVCARKAPVLIFTNTGNSAAASLSNDVIYMPKVHPVLQPIVSTVYMHLFSYYIGVEKGLNVDKPRNLAKSVTVE